MQSLAERAVRGDAEAFLSLCEEHSLTMYKVARSILKNEADVADAVQDTILSCFEKIHTLKNPQYFKTWMIRILINECNDILRHYEREGLPGEIPETPREDQTLAEFEFKEMLDCVEEKYRLTLVLYYVEGFKTREIAELLEMKEATVKTWLSRGREQIRMAYGGNRKRAKTGRKAGIASAVRETAVTMNETRGNIVSAAGFCAAQAGRDFR